MLEQTHNHNPSSQESLTEGVATISIHSPLSVPAPRAASVAAPAPHRSTERLGEMVARAELLLLHLESRLHDERTASERAARATAEMEERLRLGVRMLQAIDMQVERGEQASAQAQELLVRAESHARESTEGAHSAIKELAEGLVREKFDWIERELAWRFERVKEIEERIEHAANGKLAWLDTELGHRLARVGDACTQVESALARADAMMSRLASTTDLVERAERVSGALIEANAESERQVLALSQRLGDAAALREAVGTVTHEVAAAREVVGGELRRMRDDLFWLTERGERISSELVERADSAAACAHALRAHADAANPILQEFTAWMPLLTGENRERLGPVADAIAGRVRDTLAIDMRGFSTALRQFADRADHAFAQVRLDPAHVDLDARSAARTFATELSRLTPMPTVATIGLDRPAVPIISANAPLEITA